MTFQVLHLEQILAQTFDAHLSVRGVLLLPHCQQEVVIAGLFKIGKISAPTADRREYSGEVSTAIILILGIHKIGHIVIGELVDHRAAGIEAILLVECFEFAVLSRNQN